MRDFTGLSHQGIQQFTALRREAVNAVSARFFREHASNYAQLGERGREACREDIGFHLEFLRPVLEFGLLQPMVDYLHWLAGVLESRGIPAEHLPLSLDWLAEFFADQISPPDGAVVAVALQAAKAKFLDKGRSVPDIYVKAPAAWSDCAAFEAELLKGDRNRAAAIMQHRLESGLSLVDFELHVIQPALYSIGKKWQENKVSVAQEHLATTIVQSLMGRGVAKGEPAQPNGKKVLLACVQGNRHAIGLQMVADAFLMAGWDASLLGADVPSGSLVGHVIDWRPDLLGLSIAFPDHLRVAKDVIAGVKEALGDLRPGIIVGGLAINNFDQLANQIGADTFGADSAVAVASGTQLVADRKAA